MSPEQVQNMPITHATDIYALGVIAYEMLLGKPPFTAPMKMRVMVKHMMDAPPPFAETNPALDFPEAVQETVLDALEKEPKNRPKTTKDFADELIRALNDPTYIRPKKERALPKTPTRAPTRPVNDSINAGNAKRNKNGSRRLAAARKSTKSISPKIPLFSAAALVLVVAAIIKFHGGAFAVMNPAPAPVRNSTTGEIEPIGKVDLETTESSRQRYVKNLNELEQLLNAGELAKAVIIGEQLVENKFDDAYVHFLLGRAHFGLGDQDKATQHFRYSKMLEPENELYALTLERIESNIGAENETSDRSDSEESIAEEVEDIKQ
jgi:serine/threonine protein kinase